MDCEFIAHIETWGSGGQMMDILTLEDGRVLAITQTRIALYADRAAFDAGESCAIVDRRA